MNLDVCDRAGVYKDPTVALVYKVTEDSPSEQYNALVPSHITEDWEEWYFWCPVPTGTYYAKDLLEAMLKTMETDLCILTNTKLDEDPQFNSGIYWIFDAVAEDWRYGLQGIVDRVRGEIDTALKTQRFHKDEVCRLNGDNEESHQDVKQDRESRGLYGGPNTASGSSGRNTSPSQRSAPRTTRPSKAIPIVDPNTVGNSSADGDERTGSPKNGTPKTSQPSTPRPSKAIPIVDPNSVPDRAGSAASAGPANGSACPRRTSLPSFPPGGLYYYPCPPYCGVGAGGPRNASPSANSSAPEGAATGPHGLNASRPTVNLPPSNAPRGPRNPLPPNTVPARPSPLRNSTSA